MHCRRELLVLRITGFDPLRRFAAAQQDIRNGGQSGRSADADGTAAPDPNLPSGEIRATQFMEYALRYLVDLQPERCDDWRPEHNVVGKHPSELFGA
jgi:hypothetical protein